MKQSPFFATLVNGVSLVLLGIWGYLAGGSITTLIPVGLGIVFFALSPGVKIYNKVIAHIVTLLALGTIAALVPAFLRATGDGNSAGMFRIGAMILTTVIALGFYIKSFIDDRRSRQNITES